MSREQLVAALGSVTLHGLFVMGFLFWKLDPEMFPGAVGATMSGSVFSSPAQTPSGPTMSHVPGFDSATTNLPREEARASGTANDTTSKTVSARALTKLPKKSDVSTASKTAPVVEGSYSWPEGEKRRKVSGVLPSPANLGPLPNKVSLDLTVSPNGTVHAIKVVEPTGTGFEREAVRLLRRWRFEVLPRSVPQRESRCIVTLRVKR